MLQNMSIHVVYMLPDKSLKQNSIVVWLGNSPEVNFFEVKQDKKTIEMAELEFFNKKKDWQLHLPAMEAKWLMKIFPRLIIGKHAPVLYSDLKKSYDGNLDEFLNSKIGVQLRENGLLVL